MSLLLERVRRIVESAADRARTPEAHGDLAVTLARFDEPLRLAIAGRVKSGKSTLLNGLIRQRVAATDAGECTRAVTWYRHGRTYGVRAFDQFGTGEQVAFERVDDRLVFDPHAGQFLDAVRLEVSWPTSGLDDLVLIDTPGLESTSDHLSDRTIDLLGSGASGDRPDAVVYLLRHLDPDSVAFLDAFSSRLTTAAGPVNAIAVLSRADEIGGGRLDAMRSVRAVADRLASDPRVLRRVRAVVPVAGLVAESAPTLRQRDFDAFVSLAAVPAEELGVLLCSADHFCHEALGVSTGSAQLVVEVAQRRLLLQRFGLFGVRLAIAMVQTGRIGSADALAAALEAHSGIEELRAVVDGELRPQRDILRAHAALGVVEHLLLSDPGIGESGLDREIEAVRASAHEFAEIDALTVLRSGRVDIASARRADLEQLLGMQGRSAAVRLGVSHPTEVETAAWEAFGRWKRDIEDPRRSPVERSLAQVAVRSCEGIIADS